MYGFLSLTTSFIPSMIWYDLVMVDLAAAIFYLELLDQHVYICSFSVRTFRHGHVLSSD
jgi:hypothetical protein